MARRRRGSKPKKRGKAEVWEELASERGGHVERDKKGKPVRVDVAHGPWRLSLDTYTVSTGQAAVTYTRVRVPYRANSPFRCSVRKSNPFDAIGRLFGMRDRSVGHRAFDRRFLVRSDGEGMVRSFLLGTRVSQLLQNEPDVRLDVKELDRKQRKRAGEGVRQVVVSTGSEVKDPDKLAHMLDLCAAALDQLAALGVAAAEGVVVEW